MPTPEKKGVSYWIEGPASYAAVIGLALLIRDQNMANGATVLGLLPLAAAYKSKLAARLMFLGTAGMVIENGGWTPTFGFASGLIAYLTAFATKPRRNYDHRDDGEGIE